jgi:DNA-binding transcriptional LysR family regulator
VLAQFKQKYPDMTFHLEVTNRKLLLEKLTNHSSDLVIMGMAMSGFSIKGCVINDISAGGSPIITKSEL